MTGQVPKPSRIWLITVYKHSLGDIQQPRAHLAGEKLGFVVYWIYDLGSESWLLYAQHASIRLNACMQPCSRLNTKEKKNSCFSGAIRKLPSYSLFSHFNAKQPWLLISYSNGEDVLRGFWGWKFTISSLYTTKITLHKETNCSSLNIKRTQLRSNQT